MYFYLERTLGNKSEDLCILEHHWADLLIFIQEGFTLIIIEDYQGVYQPSMKLLRHCHQGSVEHLSGIALRLP